MLIIHGTYHWKPTTVAFRNDFCRGCEGERLAVRIRTFDMLHIFWVPLIPLGFWKRWFCATCGRQPHQNVKTRRSFKIAGAIAMALIALLFWAVPVEEDPMMYWGMRIGSTILSVIAVIAVFRDTKEPAFKQRLAQVQPYASHICPLCGGELFGLPDQHCMQCGVARMELKR